jgi:hypothetical protein
LPWLVTREQLPGCLAYIQDQPEFGARADHFEVVMPLATFQVEDFSHREVGKTHLHSGRQEIIDEIGLLGDAGTTVTGIVPPRTPSVGDYLEWLEWFIEEIKPAFVESTD